MNLKNNKAITLIALVITIVVLIILATVVINISLGQNGIFNSAKQAKDEYANAQAYESEQVNNIDSKINSYIGQNGENPTTCVITFNATGGETPTSTKNVVTGQKYNELPTPTKTAYSFDGWYTQEENGTKITQDTIVTTTENQTLYAHWNLDEYVQSGLILYLDGINNTKSGHSNSITTWEDLTTSSNNATLYNCTVENDSILFNGSTSYATLPSHAFGSYGPSTIEVVAKILNKSVVLADNDTVSCRGLGINTGDSIEYISTAIGDQKLPMTDNVAGAYRFVSDFTLSSTKNTYTLKFDGQNYNNTSVYVNKTQATKTNNVSGFSNASTYPVLGRRFYGDASTTTQWPFSGNIYAIRIYNKQLSEAEITHNYNIDKVRFGVQ